MTELNEDTIFRRPLISILFTLIVIFFFGFQLFGVFLGSLVAYPFFNGTPQEYLHAFENPTAYPNFKVCLLVIQGVGAFVGMVILPYFFLRAQRRNLSHFFHTPYVQPIFIIPLLVIVFMGVNSFFIKWNSEIHLPIWDELARSLEEKLAETTKFLTTFDNNEQFVLGFIVIAIIPAIGEEIIFRGMVQNDLYRATRNPHVAIWTAAFLFSAIHFQFYGFVPRLLLGAVFGYLYYWSGNLWMPVLAHLVNNGYIVISYLLFQRKAIETDLEKVEPSMTLIVVSGVFSAFLLYAYKNFYKKLPKSDIPD